MSKIGNFFEKLESDKPEAFTEDKKFVKEKSTSFLRVATFKLKSNFLLILIAIFSFVSMVNSIQANENSERAYDYAADAYTYSRQASGYAEQAADNSQEAADYAASAESYASDAADGVNYLKIWAN